MRMDGNFLPQGALPSGSTPQGARRAKSPWWGPTDPIAPGTVLVLKLESHQNKWSAWLPWATLVTPTIIKNFLLIISGDQGLMASNVSFIANVRLKYDCRQGGTQLQYCQTLKQSRTVIKGVYSPSWLSNSTAPPAKPLRHEPVTPPNESVGVWPLIDCPGWVSALCCEWGHRWDGCVPSQIDAAILQWCEPVRLGDGQNKSKTVQIGCSSSFLLKWSSRTKVAWLLHVGPMIHFSHICWAPAVCMALSSTPRMESLIWLPCAAEGGSYGPEWQEAGGGGQRLHPIALMFPSARPHSSVDSSQMMVSQNTRLKKEAVLSHMWIVFAVL